MGNSTVARLVCVTKENNQKKKDIVEWVALLGNSIVNKAGMFLQVCPTLNYK